MSKLTLVRSYLKDRTIGLLSNGMVTLERPWLANKPNVSCIPEGTYHCVRDLNGRFQYFRVEDVEGRTNIEWHGGTVPSHSAGCILVGTGHTTSYNLLGSKEALDDLVEDYAEGFLLEIRQYNPLID